MFNSNYYLVLFSLVTFGKTHEHGAYYHSESDPFKIRSDVLTHLPDSKKLSTLSLIGTHDSTSSDHQVLSVCKQLKYGIRVLDIHISREIKDRFMLSDALTEVDLFLQDHPREFVIIMLQYQSTKSDCKSCMTNCQWLSRYIENKNIKLNWSFDDTIGDVRGFILMTDGKGFSDCLQSLLECQSQNEAYLSTNWDLYEKWEKVKALQQKMFRWDHGECYINWLNGEGPVVSAAFVASGHLPPHNTGTNRLSTGLTTPGFRSSYPDFPRVTCFIGICTIAFEGTNILMYDHFETTHRSLYIIMADFPGQKLIDIINNSNS